MKRLLLVALLAIGFGFTSNAQDFKMAHFSIDTLFNNLPSYAQASKLLKDKQTEEQDKIVLQNQTVEKMKNALIKEQETLPPGLLQIKEQELAKEYQKLEEMQYQAQATLEQYQMALNQPILIRVRKAAENVAKRMGLLYIVEVQTAVYAGGKDVTQEILKEALKLEKEESGK